MSQFNLDKETMQLGIRGIFGIGAGILTLVLMEIADEPITGIVFGVSTALAGLVLLAMKREIGVIPCLTLIPLGITTIFYGLEEVLFRSRMHYFVEDLVEAFMVIFAVAYCIYGAVLGGKCLISALKVVRD